jgi:hypothetical protein
MKEKYLFPAISMAIILCLAVSGCFAPQGNQEGNAVTTAHTPLPADITCSVYSKSAVYAYNGSAFSFSQKNPPMFINYTVIPKNVTVNRVYTDSNTKKTRTLTYSDYSTASWFEVTVRDSATKETVFQDGFGESKGYPMYLSRTLKILKSGDLTVEFRGNDIRASTTVWVKPQGNFDESRLSEFADCMYWEGNRDTVAVATATTVKDGIYTWTPENNVTNQK